MYDLAAGKRTPAGAAGGGLHPMRAATQGRRCAAQWRNPRFADMSSRPH